MENSKQRFAQLLIDLDEDKNSLLHGKLSAYTFNTLIDYVNGVQMNKEDRTLVNEELLNLEKRLMDYIKLRWSLEKELEKLK